MNSGYNNLFLYLLMTFVVCAVYTITAKGQMQSESITVTIDDSKIISANYIGNGVQWEAYPHGDSEQSEWGNQMTEDNWQKLYKRLDFMKPRLIRLMIGGKWRYLKGVNEQGEPIIDHQKELEPLTKILEYCQKNDIQVMFGEWWPPDFVDRADDKRWIEMASEYLRFLIEDKGFTSIKYFNLVNEPNGYWAATDGDWDMWKTAVQRFQAKLEEKGIADDVQIAGPDAVAHYNHPDSKYTGKEWVVETARQLEETIGPLEMHAYPGAKHVRSGEFTHYYREIAELADSYNKPLIMGEVGFKYYDEDPELRDENARRIEEDPYASKDSNMFIYDFFYGVDMADVLIQSMNLGFDGVIAWGLDDAMHTNGDTGDKTSLKRWGFWNILGEEMYNDPEDEEIRPWFYSWSLMCRYFSQGTQILGVSESETTGLRVVAGKLDDEYTFAVVNSSESSQQINLQMNAETALDLKHYVYTDKVRPTNADGFPVPKEHVSDVNLKEGLPISVPAKSFQLFTEMDFN